jgi:hypothetical protein
MVLPFLGLHSLLGRSELAQPRAVEIFSNQRRCVFRVPEVKPSSALGAHVRDTSFNLRRLSLTVEAVRTLPVRLRKQRQEDSDQVSGARNT